MTTTPNETQRANLHKLATYLTTLQPTPEHEFSMACYLCDDLNEDIHPKHIANLDPKCGTVGCAIGHGPSAGIPVESEDYSWGDYSDRVFGLNNWSHHTYDQWSWMFAGIWAHTDNTPQGAARRIFHYLEHGMPADHREQLMGTAPYMFAQPEAQDDTHA